MTAIRHWFAQRNITTHTVWISLVAFATAFDSSPALRSQVGQLFTGHPIVVTKLGTLASNIVILTMIWAKFSRPGSGNKTPPAPPTSNSTDQNQN